MLKSPRVHPIIGMLRLAGAIAIVCLGSLLSAHGQQQWIDCTGTMTPSNNITVYSGFQDYLNKVGPTGTVYVNGPCPGNFTIWGGDNFYIIGPAVINGNIGVGHSENAVFLRYLTITNSSGDGLDVSGSKVSLDSCSVSNNAGNGVSVDNSSHVVVVGTGVFDNNGGWAGGFHIDGHSFLNIAPSGAVEIRGNSGSGIWATQADIQINGDTDISANINGPGIELLGGARAQVGDSNGTPNLIENNPNGGIDVRENSELSLFTCCSNPPDLVRNNGLFGVAAGFHSQVTLGGANITGNTGPGVNVYSGSQVDFFPASQNKIDGNGSSTDPTSAGIRIDGNSAALLRGGEISNNLGPGLRVSLNSSADFAGVSLIGNAAVIACDFSSPIATDLSLPFSSGCIVMRRNH